MGRSRSSSSSSSRSSRSRSQSEIRHKKRKVSHSPSSSSSRSHHKQSKHYSRDRKQRKRSNSSSRKKDTHRHSSRDKIRDDRNDRTDRNDRNDNRTDRNDSRTDRNDSRMDRNDSRTDRNDSRGDRRGGNNRPDRQPERNDRSDRYGVQTNDHSHRYQGDRGNNNNNNDRNTGDREGGDRNNTGGEYTRQSNFFQRPPGQQGYQFGQQRQSEQQVQRPPIDVQNLEPIKKKFISENDPLNKKSRTDVKEYRKKHDIMIRSESTNVPNPVFSFSELHQVPRTVMDEIIKAGFTAPTAIQSQAFTIALNGSDMIGIAQTGSGKTLAFLIPAIVHIAAQKPITPQDGPIALILTPTRELTLQIMGQFQKFATKTGFNAACLYGGQDKYIQRQQLRYGVQVIIACPGRLIDFIESYYTSLNRVTFLILDEADRMLDMGFEPQIRRILTQIRPDRQTLLFSATWPKEVQKLADDFCKTDRVHIQIGDMELTTNKSIKQTIHVLKSDEKRRKLLSILYELPRDGKAIIFCATKKGCEGLSHTLTREGFRCISIHGDKTQKERDFAMENFKDNRVRLLIATDVASRGLDVRDITYVINYDMPKIIEDYVHRIGRTGRAGANGIAITFFAIDEDVRLARDFIDVLKKSDQDVPEELYRASYLSIYLLELIIKQEKPPGPKPMPRRSEPQPARWDDPQFQQYMPYVNQPGLEAPIQVSTYTPTTQNQYARPYSGFSNPGSSFAPVQGYPSSVPIKPLISSMPSMPSMFGPLPPFQPQTIPK